MSEEETKTQETVTMNEEQMEQFVNDYLEAVMADELDIESVNQMANRVPDDMDIAKELAERIKARLNEYDDSDKRNNAIQAMDVLIGGVDAAKAEQAAEAEADNASTPDAAVEATETEVEGEAR